ncbi:response regulator transcription factor [Gottschalkiaceae bacterium SANA]|nr:response regulator transcription factor [Gottschalkiaceae bacterium SANA]
MNKRILVAEDNFEIRKVLELYLSNAGYEVTGADHGLQALEEMKTVQFDLAIVDLMMPKMDGFELIQEVRKVSNMPIFILSAKNEDFTKIMGLNLGADDYVTKPFNPLELVARINASFRRMDQVQASEDSRDHGHIIAIGDLQLDLNAMMLKKNGQEIELTATEYKVLLLLMQNPNQIFSKRRICENVHGAYYETDENAIMVHVSHIRDKIGNNINQKSYIKTIRGLGYKIENA